MLRSEFSTVSTHNRNTYNQQGKNSSLFYVFTLRKKDPWQKSLRPELPSHRRTPNSRSTPTANAVLTILPVRYHSDPPTSRPHPPPPAASLAQLQPGPPRGGRLAVPALPSSNLHPPGRAILSKSPSWSFLARVIKPPGPPIRAVSPSSARRRAGPGLALFPPPPQRLLPPFCPQRQSPDSFLPPFNSPLRVHLPRRPGPRVQVPLRRAPPPSTTSGSGRLPQPCCVPGGALRAPPPALSARPREDPPARASGPPGRPFPRKQSPRFPEAGL